MMTRNLFLMIALCVMLKSSASASNRTRRGAETCGLPKIEQGLIVRGQNFPRGSFPWIVALMHTGTRPPTFFCAGTLISRTFVISAAHCILDKHASKKLLPRDVLALFGAHDLNDYHEAERITLSPKKIYIHDDWNHLIASYDADISLLEFLPNKITFDDYIQPICLWDSENQLTVTEGIVTGWGRSEDPSKIHENLPKMIKAPIQTNEKCFLETKALLDLSSLRTFCAGLKTGSGVCNGDSGGGFFIKIGAVFHLKGIVSSSLIRDDGCDVSRNAVYTNVQKFKDWIKSTSGVSFVSPDEREDSTTRALREVFCTTIRVNTTTRFGELQSCIFNTAIDDENYVLAGAIKADTKLFRVRNNKNVQFLPSRIGEKLPNLLIFQVTNCGLTVVRRHYLKNLRNVQDLYLNGNKIVSIESDAFKDLISVRQFMLHENLIETLDEKLFATMTNLVWVLLKNNKISHLSSITFNIPDGKLKTVALWSNVCINDWYGDNPWDKGVTLKYLNQLEDDLINKCEARYVFAQ